MDDVKPTGLVRAIQAQDIDDDLLWAIQHAKWGEASDPPPRPMPRDEKVRRIEELEDLLLDIALIADGHKASRAVVAGENVALVTIRNMAAAKIGMMETLRQDGTLIHAGNECGR